MIYFKLKFRMVPVANVLSAFSGRNELSGAGRVSVVG